MLYMVLRSLLPHCLLLNWVESDVSTFAGVWLQERLHLLQEAKGQGSNTRLVGPVNHNQVTLFAHVHLNIWISDTILRQILHFGSHSKTCLQERGFGLEVSLHTSSFQNDLHCKTSCPLLDVVVDRSCFPCPRICRTNKHRVTRLWAAKVVVGQRTPLVVPVEVFSSKATRNTRIFPEFHQVGARIVRLLWELDISGVNFCGSSSDDPLHTKVSYLFLLNGRQF
mmetsp:Transcript_12928/g.28477  ORF Transcript_12928/g.28477 Transcript_12928/m.28477 type:complete len:224 (-) Transcript_12928:168-839(-)